MSNDIKTIKRLVEEFRGSGMSERGFCRARGISLHKFRYRRKRLEREAETGGFVQLTTPARTPSEESGQKTELRLDLPFGVRLHISGPTS